MLEVVIFFILSVLGASGTIYTVYIDAPVIYTIIGLILTVEIMIGTGIFARDHFIHSKGDMLKRDMKFISKLEKENGCTFEKNIKDTTIVSTRGFKVSVNYRNHKISNYYAYKNHNYIIISKSFKKQAKIIDKQILNRKADNDDFKSTAKNYNLKKKD